MIYDTKLVKKSLRIVCKRTKFNKNLFRHISSETFVIEGIGNSHSLFTF